MRDNNDIMVRNFGTGLWGVSNVSIRTSVWSDDVDIVDADNSSNANIDKVKHIIQTSINTNDSNNTTSQQ